MKTKFAKVAYITLNEAVKQINLDGDTNVDTVAGQNTVISTETANNKSYLEDLIYGVSTLVSETMERDFLPRYDTVTYYRDDLKDENICGYFKGFKYLKMPDDILSITSVTWDGTALTTNTQYRLGKPNEAPNYEIKLTPSAAPALSDFEDSVIVVGQFGYHRNPSGMWKSSTDAGLTAGVNSSTTTIPVTTGTKFSHLQYIRIDSEYMLVTGISSNNLTVERGVLGSTAASHLIAAVPDIYEQMYSVRQAVRRLVVRLYQNRGELSDVVVVGENTFQVSDEKVKLDLRKWTFYSG